jgi:hypothetical protein
MFTLVFVTLIYMASSMVLTGMQPWEEISPVLGFPGAFYASGANWAGQITALGELITLPIVILITIMVQPRLQYAMAEDGLLPLWFRQLDQNRNPWNGTISSGALMILIATLVPFEHLNDVISCAVLMALNLTDSSLILLWHEAPDPKSDLAHYLVFAFHMVALIGSIILTRYTESLAGRLAAAILICILVGAPFLIQHLCPRTKVFGGKHHHCHEEQLLRDDGFFRTPFVPFLPCVGIFINCYLIAQLDIMGVAGLLVCLLAASLCYFFTSEHHGVGNEAGWEDDGDSDYELNECDNLLIPEKSTQLTRSYSLPKKHAVPAHRT